MFVPLFSRTVKRTHTGQIMYKFPYSHRQVTTYKPSNVAVVKKPFPQCVCNCYNLPWWMVFALFDDCNKLFLIKIITTIYV